MISAAAVFSVDLVAQLEQLLEAARAIGQRALLLQRDLRRRRAARLSASFSALTCRRPT